MKKEWTKYDQVLWECIKVALRGFKNLEWLTDKEYGKITDLLQKAIEKDA